MGSVIGFVIVLAGVAGVGYIVYKKLSAKLAKKKAAAESKNASATNVVPIDKAVKTIIPIKFDDEGGE